MKVDGDVTGAGQRRVRRVGDGDRGGPAAAGRLSHADDVRALPRLRNGDGRSLAELQVAPIDRGDGGADRGYRDTHGQLDRVFEIGRGMVRGTARHGHHQGWVKGAQARRCIVERTGRGLEEPGNHLRNLINFLAHKGLFGHDLRAPLLASPSRSSATKS